MRACASRLATTLGERGCVATARGRRFRSSDFGGRVAYRLKYVRRGRGKHRVMAPMELMARLAPIIAPPRYRLVR
jgi:hypothetical protein